MGIFKRLFTLVIGLIILFVLFGLFSGIVTCGFDCAFKGGLFSCASCGGKVVLRNQDNFSSEKTYTLTNNSKESVRVTTVTFNVTLTGGEKFVYSHSVYRDIAPGETYKFTVHISNVNSAMHSNHVTDYIYNFNELKRFKVKSVNTSD